MSAIRYCVLPPRMTRTCEYTPRLAVTAGSLLPSESSLMRLGGLGGVFPSQLFLDGQPLFERLRRMKLFEQVGTQHPEAGRWWRLLANSRSAGRVEQAGPMLGKPGALFLCQMGPEVPPGP